MIKLTSLRWEGWGYLAVLNPWGYPAVLNAITRSLKVGGRRKGVGVVWLATRKCLQLLEAGRSKKVDSPLEPPEEISGADTLILAL